MAVEASITSGVIGALLSIGLAIGYVSTAWSGFADGFEAGPSVAACGFVFVAGVIFFPRTLGIALTPTGLLTPVCFLIAIFRNGLGAGLAMLGIGGAALLGAWVIAALRPDAVGRSL